MRTKSRVKTLSNWIAEALASDDLFYSLTEDDRETVDFHRYEIIDQALGAVSVGPFELLKPGQIKVTFLVN